MPFLSLSLSILSFLIAFLAPSINIDAQGQRETLTLQKAIQLAVENNRNIRSATLEVEKSSNSLAATRTRFYPQFSLNVLASKLLTSVDFTFEKGVFGTYPGVGPIPADDTAITTSNRPTAVIIGSIQQPVSQLYRVGLNVELMKTALQAEKEDERQQIQSVIDDVKKAYYGILQSESSLVFADESVKLYRELDRVTDDYLVQRVALKSDSLQVKAGLAKAEYDALTAQNELSTRKEQLNLLLGRDIRTDFGITDIPEDGDVTYDLASIQTQALQKRPELTAARLRLKQAEYDKRAKKAEYIPDVSLSFNYLSPLNIEFVPTNIASVGFYFSWDIYDWGRKKQEVAEKDKVVQQTRLALTEAENKILLEVNNLHRTLYENRSLIKVARLGQQAAQEVVRVTANKYKEKTALLKDVLQAQTTFEENRDQYQQALLAYWATKADFEKAIGEDQ